MRCPRRYRTRIRVGRGEVEVCPATGALLYHMLHQAAAVAPSWATARAIQAGHRKRLLARVRGASERIYQLTALGRMVAEEWRRRVAAIAERRAASAAASAAEHGYGH